MDELGEPGALFADYLGGDSPTLSERIGGFRRDDAGWQHGPGGRERDAGAWRELVTAMTRFNTRIGVGGDVMQRVTGGARIVMTGQQPGALGGPLMTLYKISTAMAVAEDAERRLGVACVPVYWMGADDVDFAEIRDVVLTGQDLTPYAAAIASNAHRVAGPVGDIEVEAVAAVWRALSPLVSSLSGAGEVTEIVERSTASGRDHGEVTARIIAAITRGRVAVVDGRDPLLRHCARELILAFFDDEAVVREEVVAEGEILEAAGYHAQLSPGPDSGVFMLRDSARLKIPAAQRKTARSALAANIEMASPGVILRNLIQDTVFRPLAVVLGPAEIAYRAQMAPAYRRYDVHRPVTFPRLSATYVPPPVRGALGHGSTDTLVTDPAQFVRDVAATMIDPAVDESVEAFRSTFARERDALLEVFARWTDAGARRKMDKRLADVGRRLDQVLDSVRDQGRGAATARWPALAHAPDAFRRHGKPQERFLSMLDPVLHEGTGVLETVMAAARAHVAGALDGDVAHIVYCG